MTILTFPSNPQTGDTYTAPNNAVYLYDGVKWTVQTSTTTSPAITNSVQDRVAPMLVNATTTGITFTYDAQTNQLSAVVTGGAKGDKGDTGAQGVSVTLQGTKATIADLPAAPVDWNDFAGQGWIVTTGDGETHLDGSLWFWNLTDGVWNDIGRIVGPQGNKGDTGEKGDRGDAGGNANTANIGFVGNKIYNAIQNTLVLTSDPEQMTASINIPNEYTLANGGSISISNNSNDWEFTNVGTLVIPGDIATAGPFSIYSAVGEENSGLFSTGGSSSILYATTDVIVRSNNNVQPLDWTFGNDGKLTLPGGGQIISSDIQSYLIKELPETLGQVVVDPGGAQLMGASKDQNDASQGSVTASTAGVQIGTQSPDNNSYTWTFDQTGKFQLPLNGDIVDSTGTSVLGTTFDGNLEANTLTQNFSYTKTIASVVNIGAGTVVWSGSFDYISSAKLLIQVECSETGDMTGWHSQVCEAIIASRGYAGVYGGPGGEPHMTVYGVTHTSVDPLVTFTVQRDPTTKLVEVVGTLTAAAGGDADLRIHSVEMATND